MMRKPVGRVLLCNDDGIDAPGMAVMEELARQIADEVWVVAPALDRSGVSNSLSLREPVRIVRRDERRYAVYGTPADCVAFGVDSLLHDAPPELLLSGINSGSNIGFETILSGTVGAAMTGALLGIPAIAMSQVRTPGRPIHWRTAATHGVGVIRALLAADWSREVCLSVNFPATESPDVKGMKVTTQGMGTVKGVSVEPVTDPEGEDYYWLRVRHGEQEDHDSCEAVAVENGYISVTPLGHERTSGDCRERLLRALHGAPQRAS